MFQTSSVVRVYSPKALSVMVVKAGFAMGVGGSLSVTHTVAKQEALRPRISVTVTSMSSWGMELQSKVLSSNATFQMGASEVVPLST